MVPLFTTASTESARLCLPNHGDRFKSNLQVLPRAFSSQPRHLYTGPTTPPAEGFLTCSWLMSSNCPSPFYLQTTTLWTISLWHPRFRSWWEDTTCYCPLSFLSSSFLDGIPGHPLISSSFLSIGLASPCFLSLPTPVDVIFCKSLIPNPSTSVLINSFHFVKVILITQYLNFKLLFKIMQVTHVFFYRKSQITNKNLKGKTLKFQVPEG